MAGDTRSAFIIARSSALRRSAGTKVVWRWRPTGDQFVASHPQAPQLNPTEMVALPDPGARRNGPHRCNSGTTSSTNSSIAPGEYIAEIIKPSPPTNSK
jgi:hypothetical protein